MVGYIRTAGLFAAFAVILVLASCSGSGTADFSRDEKAPTAKPARPTAVPGVYPGVASAPVLARYYDAGSTAAGDATIVKWEWNFGGGWVDATETSGEIWRTITKNGTAVAHLRVTDSNGQVSLQASVKLQVRANANAAPVATIVLATANSTTFQFGGDGSYDPDGSIVLFEWDFDNDGIFEVSSTSTSETSHSFPGGDFPVAFRVTDNDGATATATVTVHGNFPPIADIEVLDYTPGSGDAQYSLSFAGSSDVEGPLQTAWVEVEGEVDPIEVDINEPFNLELDFEDPFTKSLTLTVIDGLNASDSLTASFDKDGNVFFAEE